MLEAKNRIRLEMPCFEWIKQSIELMRLTILPFSPAIAVESCHLPGAFHEDPADRIIVATARVENCAIVTRDTRILNYSRSKYVTAIKG